MKILSKGAKTVVQPESIDDLWCLSELVLSKDIVAGTTYRKITIGDKAQDKARSVKKPIFVVIMAEKVVFSEEQLRINGTVLEGPEEVPKGSFQSISVQIGDTLEIRKEWLKYEMERLNESTKTKENLIACLYDRSEAIFAKLEKGSFIVISKISGKVSKKGNVDEGTENFFSTISKELIDLDQRFKPKYIICGSAHFWQNYLKKELSNLSKKIIFATISDVNEIGFSELLRKEEVKTALRGAKEIEDLDLAEELFVRISKNGAVAYGIKDVSLAAESGIIQTLLCTQKYISTMRDNNSFEALSKIFSLTESTKGDVKIINSKKIDGLGGIAAILRYKM
jgi:protein pelota